jgi:radical SAM superfamily enzyme YgiQ (UPF0313 family)
MSEMGIKHISVGMESASPRILRLVQKDITVEEQLRCANALAKYGIWPLYYWIIKLPTETPLETMETLNQSDKLYKIHSGKLTQDFYTYTALPGSPLFDLVDKSTLPKTMEEWSNYSLNQTYDNEANAIYWIGGLYNHRGKGDKTDRNFPGLKRILIIPFELMAILRWRLRWFTYYKFEKWAIETILKRITH